MAPSKFTAYLRPHHKRANSHPNSPEPPPSASSAQSFSDFFATQPKLHDNSSVGSNSPVSPFPPVLPPIPRIASRHSQPVLPKQLRPTDKAERAYSATEGIVGYGYGYGAAAGGDDGSPVQAGPSPGSTLPPESWRDTGRRTSYPVNSAPTGLRTKGQRPPAPRANVAQLDFPHNPHAVEPTGASLAVASPYASQSSLASFFPAPERQAGAMKPQKAQEPGQHGKTGKTRLNLRNPMSLLLRRRSGQAAQLAEDAGKGNQIVPAMTLPDDYDPRIKGSIVHDFSAPRPRRNQSFGDSAPNSGPDRPTNRSDGLDAVRQTDDESPTRRDRAHTPVFVENFDMPDADASKRESAIRAETLANAGFLARNMPEPDYEAPLPPPFGARNLVVSSFSERRSAPAPLPLKGPSEPLEDAPGLATVPEAEPSPPMDPETKRTNAIKTPPKTRSRATSGATVASYSRSRAASGADQSFLPAGLPSHFTSRASRFSFQMAGVDSSTQEKLLEERHKQKAAAKAAAKGQDSGDEAQDEEEEEEEDIYDYDDMDDDGGYDDIPMLGEEDADAGFMYTAGNSSGLGAFEFDSSQAPSKNPLSPISMSGESIGAPVDASRHSLIAPYLSNASGEQQGLLSSYQPPPGTYQASSGSHGLDHAGIESRAAEKNIPLTSEPERSDVYTAAEPSKAPQHIPDLDDELYFDDGMIGEPDPEDGEAFDESAFDDPSHPLYERPAPAPKPPPQEQRDWEYEPTTEDDESANVDEDFHSAKSSLAPHPSVRLPANSKGTSDPFDFSNLAAYHDALANAANKAEADGRFARKLSIATTDHSTHDEDEKDADMPSNDRNSSETAPSLVTDSNRVSGPADPLSPPNLTSLGGLGPAFEEDAFGNEYSDYDYDSALEDDPMIAAANAEALAYNDYDEDYGTEFGFYAAANGQGDAFNGGYFGPRGIDPLGRSMSGRNAVREPNLTPITERSEYSTRNSFIGLNHFGPPSSAGPIPSPGLAQLARMSPYGFPTGSEDDYSDYDISLEQLMKLRKGTFGKGTSATSQGSAGSSPRNSSPMSYFPGMGARGTSPVMTRSRANWEGEMASLQEKESSDDDEKEDDSSPAPRHEDDEEDELEDDDLVAAANQELRHSFDMNDSSNDISPGTDENTSNDPTLRAHEMSAPSNSMPRPPAINTAHDQPFLPEHPGNIPVSVPTSAISTTSSSSLPLSASAATPASSTLTQAQMLSPLSPNSFSGGSKGLPAVTAAVPHSPAKGHSRAGSAADSVTYVRERIEEGDETKGGEVGAFRWVLERRRTASTGELELVGREIVEGGRI
ncbi:hypothetical protein K490DRAFT_63664 [Saccharata proteae CBS 121410]|uniref:AGC-kinase C-terminal domain-containing protein n=1 Tax=Saccharata proteae CBS 121410 TaxID=1314787 RepID=A0A6A5YDH3_9PEZI|nr:hypothetical protein K490DRAFT_63664 [Saccharata proteae CBS 121410]